MLWLYAKISPCESSSEKLPLFEWVQNLIFTWEVPQYINSVGSKNVGEKKHQKSTGNFDG